MPWGKAVVQEVDLLGWMVDLRWKEDRHQEVVKRAAKPAVVLLEACLSLGK